MKAVHFQDLISDPDSDGDLKFRQTISLGNPFISYDSQVILEKCKSAVFLEKSKHNTSQITCQTFNCHLLTPLPSQVVRRQAFRVDTNLQNPFLLKKAYINCYWHLFYLLCHTCFKGKFYFCGNQSFTVAPPMHKSILLAFTLMLFCRNPTRATLSAFGGYIKTNLPP